MRRRWAADGFKNPVWRELFDDGSTSKESKKPSLTEAHLVWEFPTEVRQLNVPFEFRDLPIPYS